MGNLLTENQKAAVTVLLKAGKTVREISKFAELEASAVTAQARALNLHPEDPREVRAKQLFAEPSGLTYQQIAEKMNEEGFTLENGKRIHYLTVSHWALNNGWAWGGAEDGDYVPPTALASRKKAKYAIRISRRLADKINGPAQIARAADIAFEVLESDQTNVVQVAVVKGAAASGSTDIYRIRKNLLSRYGDQIRNARI